MAELGREAFEVLEMLVESLVASHDSILEIGNLFWIKLIFCTDVVQISIDP
jgi:hypothetical protein